MNDFLLPSPWVPLGRPRSRLFDDSFSFDSQINSDLSPPTGCCFESFCTIYTTDLISFKWRPFFCGISPHGNNINLSPAGLPGAEAVDVCSNSWVNGVC